MTEEDSEPPTSESPLIERYVALCARRPWLVLACLFAVTVALSTAIPRLSLQTQIEALLPEDTVSQRSNDEATRRYAGSSPYFLVVQSSDSEKNRAVAEAALKEVQKWPETLWAIRARDPQFFLDRRLLFVDEEPLGKFADDVDAYVSFKKCEKMPGCFQLDDEPPEPSFEELEKHLKGQPEVKSLAALFGSEVLDSVAGDPDGEVAGDPDGEGAESKNKASKEKEAPTGELCSADGSVCVVQATLNQEPTDLAYASRMVKKGEDLLTRLKPRDAPSDMITEVTGVYRNLPLARDEMMRDLTQTFGIGILLVALVIMAQFRPLRALVLLFVPLIFGSTWALGIFAFVSPKLNLISAAGFIILAGLGIDFGLHLLTHYGHERREGHSAVDAVRSTLVSLKYSLTVAALTTACGFAALIVAEFRGFAQLGLFATIGIFSTLTSSLLAFPPLVLGLQKIWPQEGAFARVWKLPAYLSQGFSRTAAIWVTSVGIFAFAVSVLLLPRLSLRYDLTPLIQQSSGHGTHFRDALRGTSRGAVLILADTPKHLEEAAAGLRKQFPNGLSGKPSAKGQQDEGAPVITPGTFLPEQQEEKLEHIAVLRKAAKDAMRFSDEEWKAKLRPWLPLLELKDPLHQKDLPDWVMFSLRERDGTFGTVGLTYQDYKGEHAGQMLELSRKLDVLRKDHPDVRFSSSNAVLGEVMPLLTQDGWRVTALAMVGVFIATLLIGRSRRRTLLILSTLLLSVGAAAAFMVIFDWPVDFYNMLVFPVAFGIGVDGAIYVAWTVLARGGKYDFTTLPVSVRAVIGSTMTTFVVFASLSTSSNGGLSSLGTVGSAALLLSLVANIVWLPGVLSWLSHAREKRGEPIEAAEVEV